MNILNKAIQIQYQPCPIRADDLMQSLIVARKETAVATFTVIHGEIPPLKGILFALSLISTTFNEKLKAIFQVYLVCINIIAFIWLNCNIQKTGWPYV